MESYIEKVTKEAVELRSAYTARYFELEELTELFAAADAELAELMALDTSRAALSLLTGWLHEKRRRALSLRTQTLMVDKADAEIELMRIEHEASRHWRADQDAYYQSGLIEATKAGVTIATRDPEALERAQWMNANIAAEHDPYTPVEAYSVDTLTQEQLAQNLLAYPEMSWEFTDHELAQARTVIEQLPLTHTSQEGPLLDSLTDASGAVNIYSYSRLQEQGLVAAEYGDEGIRGFTLTLDEKMGLHKYVFMCLGYPYYGQRDRERTGVMLIDQSLLYDDACIVTPDDISLMCPDVFHGAGIELPRHLDSLGDYRASVVSGKGWVEILSRRLARHKQEHPDEPYPIKSCLTLGEIKYRDEIPSSAIKYVIHTNQELQEYMQSISSDAIAWPPRTTI